MRRHALPVLVVALAMGALPAGAQAPVRDSASTAADSVIPDSRLFVRSDLYVLAAFVAGTVALFPLDRELASSLRSDHLVDNRTLRRIEHALDVVGGPGTLAIGGTMYLAGRFAGVPRAAHLALHTSEAIVVGISTSVALKLLLGRARPYVSARTDPGDFGFARGLEGSDFHSFPSGHSTASFAVAAAVTSETAEWWPRARWFIGPVLFSGATLVGLSRMYDDKHWASDVAMGAAIGTFAGLKTVRFNHTRTGNRIDRWLLGDTEVALRLIPANAGETRFAVDVTW